MEKIKRSIPVLLLSVFILFKLSDSVFAKSSINPLIDAIRDGNVSKIKRLIETNRTYVNLPDTATGKTPIMVAVEVGADSEVISILLKNDAYLNQRDTKGRSLYCYAKTQKNNNILNTLLREGMQRTDCVAPAGNRHFARHWKKYGLGLGVAGGIAAAGGGGGGGGGGASSTTTASTTDYVGTDVTTQEVSAHKNDEYNENSSQYDAVRSAYAYARGYDGTYSNNTSPTSFSVSITSYSVGDPVKVAVIDTGIDIDHVDLSANITSDLTGTNLAYDGTMDHGGPNDPRPLGLASHGTHVTGIIGAVKNNSLGSHGVAYNSEIIPFKATDNTGEFVQICIEDVCTTDYDKMSLGITRSIARGDVVAINNSYGITNQEYVASVITSEDDVRSIYDDTWTDAIKTIADNDLIMVYAAGNNNLTETGVEGGIPIGIPSIQDYFMVVVATNSTGTAKASYSNACGAATKNWCISAPGSSVYSTIPNDGYGTNSGTSMAAPMVTGAIAVLKGAFPYLTAPEITDLLFSTARDIGAAGVDNVYGHGVLNLEEATRPVGTPVVPLSTSVTGSSINLSNTTITSSQAFGSSLNSFTNSFVILDKYKRAYNLNISDYVENTSQKYDFNDAFSSFTSNQKPQTAHIGKMSLSLSAEQNPDEYSNINFEEMHLGYNNIASVYFGEDPYKIFTEDDRSEIISFGDYNILNPYFKNTEKSYAVNYKVEFSDKLDVTIGNAHQYNTLEEDGNIEDVGTTKSFIFNAGYQINNKVKSNFEYALINESDSVLGSYFNGAFQLKDGTKTHLYSLSNDTYLSDNISLFGKYSFGVTEPETVGNSLIKDVSTLYSDSFILGTRMNLTDRRNKKSNLSFSLSQPVRIKKGDMKIALPRSRDMEGNIYYSNHDLDLSTDGRELNFQTSYNVEYENDLSTNFVLGYKTEANNSKSSPDEYVYMVRMRKGF